MEASRLTLTIALRWCGFAKPLSPRRNVEAIASEDLSIFLFALYGTNVVGHLLREAALCFF